MKRAPRLEVDLDKVFHNAQALVRRLGHRGVSITGVTKAALGSADIARVLVKAGVMGLGDSRIENIESMRHSNIDSLITMIRSPMLSEIEDVVAWADVSCNTELEVVRQLSKAACKAGRVHRVLLMVELGDLREGIMPEDLIHFARETLRLPKLVLEGIGTNLACRSGVPPGAENMARLSSLAADIEERTGQALNIVSGGNSANIDWALGDGSIGRINNLRLGEAILLGREALQRTAIPGLYTDAFTLIAEVIESKTKPSKPVGRIMQNAFGQQSVCEDRGMVLQSILALGRQDVDADGLQPERNVRIAAASSDHLMIESPSTSLPVGSEVRFQPNYSALLRAMTSPFVAKLYQQTEHRMPQRTQNLRARVPPGQITPDSAMFRL